MDRLFADFATLRIWIETGAAKESQNKTKAATLAYIFTS
jgi:hypothetical protein